MNVVSNVEIMGLVSSVKASRYPMATDTEISIHAPRTGSD